MISLLRNKTVVSLLALLILGMGIGVAHDRSLEAGTGFPARDLVRLVLAPIDTLCHRVIGLGNWLVGVSRPRKVVLSENKRLRAEVKRLTAENARLREAANENVGLREALGLKQSTGMRMVPAEVISRKESNWFDTATIDCGTRGGAVKGAAVVNARGIVGQIVECDLLTSQVIALTDPDSGIGAMIQRSRSSGILRGEGGADLVLTYLPKDADVKESDIVVTSGMGRVIPKGFVVGRVVDVVRNSVAGSTTAVVRPSVRMDELEQVFVVKPGAAE